MTRKPALIEPIKAPFESVLRAIVNAPEKEQEQEIQALSGVITDPALKKWVNKIHCSDNIEFMNKLPEKSISLIVTSPPYNIKNSTGNGLTNGSGGKWPKAELIKGYDVHDDNMPHDKYVEWQRKCLTAMMRILKKDGAIFYNHKWRVQAGLLQDRHDIVEGFPVRQIIIWKRAGGINFNPGYFLPTYEVIYMIANPDFKLAEGANKMTDIWEIPQSKGNEHPAPFPIELAQKCIGASPGGVVLDPFMGSGTTALAAMAFKRDWIGIDISQDYCNMAEKRIKEYKSLAKPELPFYDKKNRIK